jgi:CHAT domain-containing protein
MELKSLYPWRLLTVSQQNTPNQCPLPRSTEEVKRVAGMVSSAGWCEDHIVSLNDADATVLEVSEALDQCSWVHFACHGLQDPTSGMKSAFALYDGSLELAHLASKRLTHGRFAFLSVCHAASGLLDLPGEAMHLAAGVQFIGFTSVIATMWGIDDEDAPKVAAHTYEYLFRNGLQKCDPSEAATALNFAVKKLREDPEMTLDRWAPFIHFGV